MNEGAAVLLCFLGTPGLLGALAPCPAVGAGTRWWIGLAVLGQALVLGRGLGVPMLAPASLLLYALWALRHRGTSDPVPAGAAAQPALLAGVILLLLGSAAGLHVITNPVIAWDAVVIWHAKTRALLTGASLGEVPMPDYPSLGPLLQAFALGAAGTAEEAWGRLLPPLAYVAWASSLLRLASRTATGVALSTLAAIACFDLHAYTSGYQDGLLALWLGMAALQLASAAGREAQSRCLLAALFAGSAAAVKNEGAGLALLLFAAAELVSRLRPGLGLAQARRRPAWILLLALLALGPLIKALHGVPPFRPQGDAFTIASVAAAPFRVERLLPIGGAFLAWCRAHAGLLASAAALSLVAARRAPLRRPALLLLWLAWAGHVIFVVSAFLATRSPLAWHLAAAHDRLMIQSVPLLAAAVCVAAAALQPPSPDSLLDPRGATPIMSDRLPGSA